MTEVKTKKIPKKNIDFSRLIVPDLLSMALWAMFSFAVSGTFLFGKTAPFGAAAVAASKRNCLLPSAAGAIMGYILSQSPENTIRYIAAVLMAFGAKLVFERFAEGDSTAVLVAGGATAFSSFGYAAATIISGYTSALALAETVLSCGAAYFFRRTGKAFEKGKPVLTLSGSDRACVIMTAVLVAASFSGIKFGKISLGEVLSGTIILTAAAFAGASGGAVAGIASGTAVSLTAGTLGANIAGYALGGLMGGVFSPFGKIIVAAVFVVSKAVVCFLAKETYPDYIPIYESVISAVIFMFIPQKAEKALSSIAFRSESSADAETVKELVLSKMGRAAEGLIDIATATKRVASSLEKENTGALSTVLNSAAERNCRACSKNPECWKKQYPETAKAFLSMGNAAKTGKNVFEDESFCEKCVKSEAVYNDIKKLYKEAADKNSAERKIRKVREVVTDQFEGAALLLRDIAAEASSVKNVDKKLSAGIRSVFENRDIPIFACTCYYTVDGCLNAEISGAKERLKKADLTVITEEISDICGCDMAKPVKRDTENARRLFFCEKPLVQVRFGTASINAEGEKFCGDSAEFFTDQYGCAHMILSDGMGSGERAALNSMMTAGLVARMVRAGFRFGPAIKLVNSALLLKSEEESFATVDAFSVNLYSGMACFYKAGAEASFVMKNGKVSKLESVTLPVGILGGTEYEQSGIRLGEGDTVLMITDGVTAAGSEWIPSELRSLGDKSAEEIASGIAKTAFDRRNDGHSDDITVLVMKLVSGY
ncbi:MAG: SpoIIE family protein phosphatase [Oscillospiraceae bacterium]|nr:SpoIIE family protein phosphatase [Oscillospiraceae bacterium]